MKNDIVTLVNGQMQKDGEGYNSLAVVSQTDVFAEVSSPKRAQRDSALRHDYTASLTVKLFRDEYGAEKYIRFGEKLYEVKEVYALNADELEITCSDWRC